MKILLTGDDGYNSAGTRILVHYLKPEHELFIAGTSVQQSAAGGKMTLKEGFDWEIHKVEGVKALKVEGTPVDAIELTSSYFPPENKFAITISGINWGWNLSSFIISSGTVSAAIRAAGNNISKKAIIFSWNLPSELYFKDNSHSEDISKLLDYPGVAAKAVFDLIVKNDFWGAQVINVNFPTAKSRKVKFVYPEQDTTRVYRYDYLKQQDEEKGHFSYPMTSNSNTDGDNGIDYYAVNQGWITLTPLRADLLDERTYATQKKQNV